MKRVYHAAAAVLAAALALSAASCVPRIPAFAGETETDSVSGETAAAQEDSQDSRIAQEKAYLLEALNQIQEWGLSPISIWAGITGDDSVLEIIESTAGSAAEASDSLSETLSEAGSEAVSDITESVTEAVTDVVEEQTEKVKQSILEQIRSMINNFLDNL